MILNVQNLSFAFQRIPLFKALNFELKAGELLHLKGTNGSGKSTLLSILAGLRKDYEGDVHFYFEGEKQEDPRLCTAYLAAEHNGLYQRLTAKQHLDFWFAMNGQFDERSLSCLEHWGLSKPYVLSMPVYQFSTGMKRRLGLARMQVANRSCLLLDEPLNGLDRQGISLFKTMMEKLLENNGCAVVVSHEWNALQGLITKEISL